MQPSEPDHYATLGLDRNCSSEQVRAAYRILAKQHHPDVNPGSRQAQARTQELNAAYEILSDAARRKDYDEERSAPKKKSPSARGGTATVNISKEVHLGIQDFLRGALLDVQVKDPGNPNGIETYKLIIPPTTAPGTRFRIPRVAPFERGFVLVKVKARPDFRFKVRGPDLRCDLKISFQRAQQGGVEKVRSVTGNFLTVPIPRGVTCGEIIRLAGEGLPKARGGRGDLVVRIIYQPQIHIVRASRKW